MAIIDIWDNIAKQINDEFARVRALEDSGNKVDEFIQVANLASTFVKTLTQVITQINDIDLIQLTDKGFESKYGKIIKQEYYTFQTSEEQKQKMWEDIGMIAKNPIMAEIQKKVAEGKSEEEILKEMQNSSEVKAKADEEPAIVIGK